MPPSATVDGGVLIVDELTSDLHLEAVVERKR